VCCCLFPSCDLSLHLSCTACLLHCLLHRDLHSVFPALMHTCLYLCVKQMGMHCVYAFMSECVCVLLPVHCAARMSCRDVPACAPMSKSPRPLPPRRALLMTPC
jgi:hypothetical protein